MVVATKKNLNEVIHWKMLERKIYLLGVKQMENLTGHDNKYHCEKCLKYSQPQNSNSGDKY